MLLPIAVVVSIVFIAAGMVQNLHGYQEVTTLAGQAQTITGGPVASQEAIKDLGTNGGGFYNVNSAHPFENPTTWTNWIEIFLLLMISFSLPRTFGRMVGSTRQGLAIVAVMAVLAIGSQVTIIALPEHPPRHGAGRGRRGHRGHGDPVRGAAVRDVRLRDDVDLDRVGGLVPRLVHQPRAAAR